MLAHFEYGFLRWAYSRGRRSTDESYEHKSKLETLLGAGIFARMRDKFVVDFGCGYGDQTIELARRGARNAVGIDIREELLTQARAKAVNVPTASFATPGQCGSGIADIVISIDSFEHFADPAVALRSMYDLLVPGGVVLASFGPPWFHPLGGHAFSVFPWSHLILSERALCRWYNDTHHTAIRRFEDVSGGLNRMTLARFDRLVAGSPFSHATITAVPIRKLRRVHNALTREFTTSVVTCELRK